MSRAPCRLAAVVVVACVATIGQSCATAGALRNQDVIELRLPRAAAADEAVALELRIGALAAGARLRILSDSGEVLGVIAPFGRSAEGATTTHTVPLPPSVIRDGSVRLQLVLEQPDAAPRAPSATEVESIALIYVPVTPS